MQDWLQRLKMFDNGVLPLEQMISLSAFARLYDQECKEQRVELPEWFAVKRLELQHAIGTARADQLALRINQARQRVRATMTREDRRREAEAELVAAEAELAALHKVTAPSGS